MVGIRRTDGQAGCPPTETPVDGYKNPFFTDTNGALWVKNCFKGLIYFGESRHDVLSPVAPGGLGVPVNVKDDVQKGVGITAGKYTTRTIVNTTPCTLGVLLGHNMHTDMTTAKTHMVTLTLSTRWNGEYHSRAKVSTQRLPGATGLFRKQVSTGACPHDLGAPDGGSSLQIPPGGSANVSCRLSLQYYYGAPIAGEMIWHMSSAVRIYGYVLG